MLKQLFCILLLLMLYACNKPSQQDKANKIIETAKPDSLVALQVTKISDLPDSLQPQTIYLDKMPKSLTFSVPDKVGASYSITNSKGEVRIINLEPPDIKSLAVLKDEKGEIITDPEGKPFMMGNGGKSNFTNFTTDNGLALDAISCSVEDKTGNLWFGTSGGGVSRYNGKTFTSFTTAQGLTNNVVYCILEDKSGNLWLGTRGGVSRYDGEVFTSFTTDQGLANNIVLSITEDKKGNLWFGTRGGVSRYEPPLDGRLGTFANFTTDQGLANNQVWSILEDRTGNLWFGTGGGGVSRYQPPKDGQSGTFTSYTTAQGLTDNSVYSILEDKTGNLWFGTNGGGVSRYEPSVVGQVGTFTTFSTERGLANNFVWSILEDKTGNLWFGTMGGGVSRYEPRKEGKAATFKSFTTAQGLANNQVVSILEDKTGNLWFGTRGSGVSRYDGETFTSFTAAHGLAANTVYSILEEKSGNFWFGTLGGGVSRYEPSKDGKAGTFESFTTNQGLVDNTVLSTLEDKTGNVWIGTNGGGVSRYEPPRDGVAGTFTSFKIAQGLANNVVRSILEDKFGNIWFGTNGGGVSCYRPPKDGKPGSITNFSTAQGLAGNFIYSILEDKIGNLWIGTGEGGVSRYQPPVDGKSGIFTSYTTIHGLANNGVYSIFEDKTGNLWFGTSEGLSVLGDWMDNRAKTYNPDIYLDPQKGKTVVSSTLFKSFKIADGLPDNFVTNVIQMPNGKMAVGTNLGITIFNLAKDGSKLTDIEIYNTNTGYPVKDVNVGQNCMLLDSKGIIWAGTGSEKTALVRFDYASLRKNNEPPSLVIQAIKVKDENICWYNLKTRGVRKNVEDSTTALIQEFLAYGRTLSTSENDAILRRFSRIQFDGISKFYPLPQNLVLPYEHNQITFEFAAIETGKPFLVKYQYMLEGYDRDWSPITDKSNANFGNVNEGTYTFKLKAQGANGAWSEPITYTFKVLPPWFRTWWAYLIYTLLFLLALRIFSKWRERHLRAEKERLEKTVEERTEELVEKNIAIENEKLEANKQRDEADKQRVEADKQRKRSDDLLLNILPEEVAEELKAKGSAEAKQFDEVTVLFTDYKKFTELSEKLTPKELVADLNHCFSAFDEIMQKHGIEKIKTIGDAYMAAGGLPTPNKTHAKDVVLAALEICDFIEKVKAEKIAAGLPHFEIRIGIHSGPLVAGIVGVKKFQYDIWGDTVNTASRMESAGEAGKVNISQSTYELLKNDPDFEFESRGKISAKGKGEMEMLFVTFKNQLV